MPEHEFVADQMHLPYTVCQPKPTEFRIHLLLYVMQVPFRIPSIHKTLSAHILHRLRVRVYKVTNIGFSALHLFLAHIAWTLACFHIMQYNLR